MTVPDHFMSHLAAAQAAIVVDGSADDIVSKLLSEGWTWADTPEVRCSGKRIRYLHPPKGQTA